MKRFLKRLLLFLSLGLLIIIFLFITAEKYDSNVDFRIKQLLSKADSIEALAIGNSHSCAIDFNAMGMNGYRIALGGNDISEAEYQIKSLVPLLPKLKTVFFNISYFSLFIDNSSVPDYYSFFNKIEYKRFLERFPFAELYLDTSVYSDYIIINTEGISSFQRNKLGAAMSVIMEKTSDKSKVRWSDYNSIPVFNWVKGDFWNYIRNRISVITRNDHWLSVINNFLFGTKLANFSTLDSYGQSTNSLRYSYKSRDSLNTLAKDILVPHYLSAQQIVLQNNSNVLQDNCNCLVSVIDYLKARDIRIIFYTSPVYKSFTDYYDKPYINIMKQKIQAIKELYDIEYYDFSIDSFFITNNKLFYNSDHLNRQGAKEFSKKFSEILIAKK